MRVPNRAHTSRPWRIHELTGDFRLQDVWALPTPGGPHDFPRLVRQFASGERAQGASCGAARMLWAIRWKVGELLGWDEHPASAPGRRRSTTRLPADLRDVPSRPDFDSLPFTSLYLLDDEFAAGSWNHSSSRPAARPGVRTGRTSPALRTR